MILSSPCTCTCSLYVYTTIFMALSMCILRSLWLSLCVYYDLYTYTMISIFLLWSLWCGSIIIFLSLSSWMVPTRTKFSKMKTTRNHIPLTDQQQKTKTIFSVLYLELKYYIFMLYNLCKFVFQCSRWWWPSCVSFVSARRK